METYGVWSVLWTVHDDFPFVEVGIVDLDFHACPWALLNLDKLLLNSC